MDNQNRPNVTKAMSTLRLQYHWSLQEIATLFGISREAVRLRVGNTGRIELGGRGISDRQSQCLPVKR